MNQSPTKLSAEFLTAIKQDLLERKTKLEKQLLSFAERDPHQQNNFNSDFPKFGDITTMKKTRLSMSDGGM